MIWCGTHSETHSETLLFGGAELDQKYITNYFNIVKELKITKDNSQVDFEKLKNFFTLSSSSDNHKTLSQKTIELEIKLIDKQLKKLQKLKSNSLKGGSNELLEFLQQNRGKPITDSKISFITKHCKPNETSENDAEKNWKPYKFSKEDIKIRKDKGKMKKNNKDTRYYKISKKKAL